MSDIKEDLLKRLEMIPYINDEYYARMFDKHDKNKNGTLEMDELRELYKELCSSSNDQFHFSEDHFIACFKEWDANGDGSISRDELKVLLIKRMTDEINE